MATTQTKAARKPRASSVVSLLPPLLPAVQIGDRITSLFADAAGVDQRAHETAFQCLAHIFRAGKDGKPSGDVTLLERLVLGQPASFTRGLKFWLNRYARNVLGVTDNKFRLKKGWNKADDKGGWINIDLMAAWNNPFFRMASVQADRKRDPFTVAGVLKRMVAFRNSIANADADDFKGGRTMVDADQNAVLAAIDAGIATTAKTLKVENPLAA